MYHSVSLNKFVIQKDAATIFIACFNYSKYEKFLILKLILIIISIIKYKEKIWSY